VEPPGLRRVGSRTSIELLTRTQAASARPSPLPAGAGCRLFKTSALIAARPRVGVAPSATSAANARPRGNALRSCSSPRTSCDRIVAAGRFSA
jgi:hypothetical protein